MRSHENPPFESKPPVTNNQNSPDLKPTQEVHPENPQPELKPVALQTILQGNMVLISLEEFLSIYVVRELHPLMKKDFEETLINVSRWKRLTDKPNELEYLQKLDTQTRIAIRVLSDLSSVTAQSAKKLIALWKCARREDMEDYFDRIERNQLLGQIRTMYASELPAGSASNSSVSSSAHSGESASHSSASSSANSHESASNSSVSSSSNSGYYTASSPTLFSSTQEEKSRESKMRIDLEMAGLNISSKGNVTP